MPIDNEKIIRRYPDVRHDGDRPGRPLADPATGVPLIPACSANAQRFQQARGWPFAPGARACIGILDRASMAVSIHLALFATSSAFFLDLPNETT